MALFKNIIYTILSLQEKLLRFRLSKTIGVKSLSKRKQHYSKGCTIDLNSMAEKEKQQLEEELVHILKTYEYEPLKILEYIKKQGTDVIFSPKAKNILNSIGESEGFIYPSGGARALYLSLAFLKKFSFKTGAMFIFTKEDEINKYYFMYNFYNWYAFKHNISGMDSESQDLLKKYLYTNADTKELQLSDIYKLKDAIRQDKASIEFVIKLCRNYEGAKQALSKIKSEGSAKL